MRTTFLISGTLMLAMAGGCYVERPHHYYRDEVIVGPAPGPVVVEGDVDYEPPPAAQVEIVPARPFLEAVWVPGHWVREHHRREWVWIGGHWR